MAVKKWKSPVEIVVNGKKCIHKAYDKWHSMMRRCYSEKALARDKTYIGCSVCEEWHNYDVFYKWFEKNYIEGYDLDKDLLENGNKIYSAKTCCFVPHSINSLLLASNASRGKYPIGVNYHKKSGRFVSQISINGNRVHIGLFKTPEEAFEAYKAKKESTVLDMANKYFNSGMIDERIYNALISFKVAQ